MAGTYSLNEIFGNSVDVALAQSGISNTPETSVPSAFPTITCVKAAQKMLRKLGVMVKADGVLDAQTASAMARRFGPAWKQDYRWSELLHDLYNDTKIGRLIPMSGVSEFLDVGPKIGPVPLLPVVVGAGVLWLIMRSR